MQPPRLPCLSTRTKRVASRRPAGASRRPPPSLSNKDRSEVLAGGLAGKLDAEVKSVSTALGGKTCEETCASLAPRGRSPCSSVSLAGVRSDGHCVRLWRGRCGGSRQGKTARVTLLFCLSSRLGQDHGHGQGQGQVRRPPWGRQRCRRVRRLLQVLPQLRTTVRTSWHLRVIASCGESILMNAARKSGANIVYYVAHVDYIQYISGLKPIREGVILVCLTATTAAGELRAYATIVGMGITYISPDSLLGQELPTPRPARQSVRIETNVGNHGRWNRYSCNC